ncbi:MAG: septal ring lytic transglycosylase RlpA family protein [Propylenella sp.]
MSIGICAALTACTVGSGPGVRTAKQVDPPSATKGDLWIPWFFKKKSRPASTDPAAVVASGFEVVEEADPTVSAAIDRKVLEAQAEMVRGGGRYWVGRPYEMAGKLYEPQEDPTYDEIGLASWYGSSFHGRITANGEIFDRNAISAAHPTMPLPSYVRVTNLNNDRSIVVRVNDRGPFKDGRLIDVSEQTAALLGFRRHGLTQVRVEYVSRAPLGGEDKETLLATYEGAAERPRITLASAQSDVPVTLSTVAFAPSQPPARAAQAAIEKLAASLPATERILFAFAVAAEAEE